MPKVDIIVPIYNAYEFTEECIKSVLKHTDLKNNNLILINDKSPDKKILPMLKKYEESNPDKNVIVLDNEQNLGFVKTVNKGIKYSENDVLLLNSDTEVTRNWLEKITECAYSNEYISTVTPLTNNGTIASVPNFGVDNELPKNMSLDEYADMIEKCSLKRFPELTTANGFCMFIKRDAINEVGLFDDITFGKGYGEENDFCYRALNHGYTHVLCDNTFIYHKGTQSFKAENMTADRIDLVQEHMKKLTDKYPQYVGKTDYYLGLNPIRDIQENIRINIDVYSKKRILFLVNEWNENLEMTAGTSLHLKDIIMGIKNEMACFVLCPNKKDLSIMNLYLYTENTSRLIFSIKTEINLYGQIVYHDKSYSEVLEKLFEIFNFDIVHVHHLLFQTFDIADIAKKHDAYLMITLHDLYMLCPSINMIYEDEYCEKIDTEKCQKCFKQRHLIDGDILENWRKNCSKALKKFDRIIVPSENTKSLFQDVYSDLKIEVREHGVELYKLNETSAIKKDTFDIAFVGVMEKHKGSETLKKLVKNSSKTNMKIHLFGKTSDRELQENTENYIFHGPYQRGALPQLLIDNKIDLVCMFSVCPETYSYTLTETYMAKVPVLAYNIGAIQDRVNKDKTGWIIDRTADVSGIFAKIDEISTKNKEYETIKANLESHKIKTVSEMQKEYMNIYEQVAETKKNIVNFSKFNELVKNIDYMKEKLIAYEKDVQSKQEYIEILETYKDDSEKKAEYINALESEEKNKQQYISVLEIESKNKQQHIQNLEEELRRKSEYIQVLENIKLQQQDQIRDYENMRVVKIAQKLKGKK